MMTHFQHFILRKSTFVEAQLGILSRDPHKTEVENSPMGLVVLGGGGGGGGGRENEGRGKENKRERERIVYEIEVDKK